MKIAELRKRKNMTQKDFSEVVGYSASTVAMWETGKREPSIEAIKAICEYFDVSMDYLLGLAGDEVSTHPSGDNWIPVLGEVRAGIPIEAIEDIGDWEQITPQMASQGEHIGLRIVGDSMEPKMSAGDVVIVHLQPDIESGEIGIVIVNGDSATVKKVIKQESGLLLVALNPAYEPKFYTNDDIKHLPISILGKVVELRAKF